MGDFTSHAPPELSTAKLMPHARAEDACAHAQQEMLAGCHVHMQKVDQGSRGFQQGWGEHSLGSSVGIPRDGPRPLNFS